MITRKDNDGYHLESLTGDEVITLFQMVYDWCDSTLSSGDMLDDPEREVRDAVYDLKDLWTYHEGGF